MACKALSAKFPNDNQLPQEEYMLQLQTESYTQGNNCISSHRFSDCPQCANPGKNPDGCYNCLKNTETCAVNSINDDQEIAQAPCCPFIEEAMTCSACLGKATSGSLAACLSDSTLSTGLIIGLVVGGVILVAVGIVALYFGLRSRRQVLGKIRLEQKLRQQGTNPDIIEGIDRLNEDIDPSVYERILNSP